MAYFSPENLDEALARVAASAPAIVAGGTDFFPVMGDAPPPAAVIDLSRVPGLRGVTRLSDGWRIGASTTWTDIVKADLPPCFDGLKAAAREVGSIQIQNAGTVAGNICNASPAADGVPPLLSLDARVELRSVNGVRELPLSAFITGVRKTARKPEEIVTAVSVPDVSDGAVSAFRKLGSRKYLVISIAMVAVVLAFDETQTVCDTRIAVGACSPVAQRLPSLEQAVTGVAAEALGDPALYAASHFSALSPIGDVRGSAEYRLESVAHLCRSAVLDAAGIQERANG